MKKFLPILALLVGVGAILAYTALRDGGRPAPPPALMAPETLPPAAKPDEEAVKSESSAVTKADDVGVENEISEEDDTIPPDAGGTGAGPVEDPIWATYVDPEDGFSFHYPKLVYVADACADAGVFRDVGIPTEIYEDERSLYVAASYIAKRTNGECEKTATTIEGIQSFFRGQGTFIGWRVTVVPVAEKSEVEAAVRVHLDDTCRVSKLDYRQSTDDFEVVLVGVGEEDCMPGSERHLVYSEGHGKLAILEGAQDCVFADESYHKGGGRDLSDTYYDEHCLDSDFVKSLRWGPGS